jgi:hypothetical protein
VIQITNSFSLLHLIHIHVLRIQHYGDPEKYESKRFLTTSAPKPAKEQSLVLSFTGGCLKLSEFSEFYSELFSNVTT